MELYPYQRTAVEFIHRANGRAIVADDMGLGKTVEALEYIRVAGIGKTLIVCPASVVFKWQKDCETWAGRQAEVILNSKGVLPVANTYIMSYAIMTRRLKELRHMAWDAFILDEFQAIKNYKAQRTRAAKFIAANVPHILMLSGTPFLNRPIELWNALNILYPKTWNNVHRYGQRYCGGLSHEGLYKGATNLPELRRRLAPFLIRRLKTEVLDQLPLLTRTYIPVKIKNMQEYKQIKKAVTESINGFDPDHKGYFVNVLDKLSLLRRVAGYGKSSIAVEFVQDMMEEIDENAKVVVFCHHKEIVQIVAEGLVSYNPVTFTGDLSPAQRQSKVEMFRAPGGPRVMVLTSAGGEGIDLFGGEGIDISRIVMVERQWTPASEEQVEARLHRIGQDYPVNAYYLVAKDTIDEKFSRMVEAKRSTFGTVLGQNWIEELAAEIISG